MVHWPAASSCIKLEGHRSLCTFVHLPAGHHSHAAATFKLDRCMVASAFVNARLCVAVEEQCEVSFEVPCRAPLLSCVQRVPRWIAPCRPSSTSPGAAATHCAGSGGGYHLRRLRRRRWQQRRWGRWRRGTARARGVPCPPLLFFFSPSIPSHELLVQGTLGITKFTNDVMQRFWTI